MASSVSPEKEVEQDEIDTSNEVKSNSENYSDVAARTVANIKRLQENVLSVNISSSSLSSSNISTVAIGQCLTPLQLAPDADQNAMVESLKALRSSNNAKPKAASPCCPIGQVSH